MESLRPRGYSLLEAILASFLLVSAFFLVSRLFHTGLQYSTKVHTRMTAVRVAEQRMAEIRRWAKDTYDWSGYPAGQNPDFPAYTITVTRQNETLFCPSTELEAGFATDKRRELDQVARRFNVEVRWGQSGRYMLSGLVTKGTTRWRDSVPGDRSLDEIVVSGTFPSPVRGESVILTAAGYDEDDNLIPGLFFHWSVEPVYDGGRPGVGRIVMENRDGSRVTFTNEIRRRDIANQPWTRGDGRCRVVCYAMYDGVLRACETEPIDLDF